MGITLAMALQLGLQYGLPFVTSAISQIESNGTTPVTAAQWASLVTLAQQDAKSKMLAVLQAQGIDPASDKGKQFLALTA
jgi:hypothetical protein